jgi:Flp pilus assembly pilin Flp
MEYMLLATLVAVVCIAGAMALGGLNSGPLNAASDGMNGQGAGDGDQPPADGNAAGGVGDGSQS